VSRIAALACGTVAALTLAATALAASPSPDTGGGDPRSPGQGPGLVGDPLFALLAVVAIGLVSVVATLVYVRLTARRST
jgi:hypothetical protein